MFLIFCLYIINVVLCVKNMNLNNSCKMIEIVMREYEINYVMLSIVFIKVFFEKEIKI